MGLKGAGINLIATLPDVNLADLLREVEEDRDLTHVPLCREEEGIGICAGAYLVGKKCAAIMQNGGFFNSNNAIVSTLLQYQIPLLLLIYYAGDIGDRTFGTTGSMTEPVLRPGTDQTRASVNRRRKTSGGASGNQRSARPACGAQVVVIRTELLS
ncbi:MAG: sulfopyruvate decarboxylase subunit alpha [Deltaproteobacteria bacterium]|nr:sulfopyruvate decarboxylase subunit alpha [Deltaproteobacteria bacterium]